MFDHVSLKVADFAVSVRFYASALLPLGFGLCSQDDTSAGFGPAGQPALWIQPGGAPAGGVAHVALCATNRRAVDEFYAQALRAGGQDNGKPGLHPEYGPSYYAAYVIDPDGNNLEAVHVSEPV
jgi:catechol 2,3-dioxygenase-like lactoylglutathione lyase family enzyme